MRARTLVLSSLALALVVMGVAPIAGAAEPVEHRWRQMERGYAYWLQDPAECDISAFPIVSCDALTSSVARVRGVGEIRNSASETNTLDYSGTCVDRLGREGTPMVVTDVGTGVAGDGSELYWHFEGSGCFVDFDFMIEVVGTTVADGGTGRFEGATGSLAVVSKVKGERWTGRAAGTISY